MVLSGASLAAGGRVDEGLVGGIMGGRCRGYRDDVFEDAIKMSGKFVASGVDVYGGVEGLDVDRLLDAPPDPVTFT